MKRGVDRGRKVWRIEGLLRMTRYEEKKEEGSQLDQDWRGIGYEEHASGPSEVRRRSRKGGEEKKE